MMEKTNSKIDEVLTRGVENVYPNRQALEAVLLPGRSPALLFVVRNLAGFAFRAVENRLAVLRSVNTGISCLIDSAGRIRDGYAQGTLPAEAMSRTGMDGWFTERIPIDSRTSFFSKHGEWLDFCCEFCVISLIMGLLSVKFFRAGKWKFRFSRRSNEKSAGPG